jgi:phenylacetate-CoA ligase
MGKLDSLYAELPVWAQHGAVSAYGAYWHWLRFGPGFARAARGYRERDRFSAEEWRAWQGTRLREVLGTGARSVPYYRATWSASQKAAAAAGRVEGLPLLGKDPVRADARAFLRDDVTPGRTLVFHTSGTTGTPVATMWTVPELRESLAQREVRSAGWAGVSFSMPRATFSGRMVEPSPASTGPFYRFNLAARYVDALRRHGVQWLTGYAVTSYLLAELVLEQGLQVPPLRAVITTSEKVTPDMRRVMERAYGCRVYEEYSTVENALFVSECPDGRLHSSPDVAHVEILRPDGTPCEPGETGEVVTTNLTRTYQSMIRFRLGDLAAWDPEPCPCGRAMPVMREIVGRIEDVVVRADGRRLVRFHGIFVDQPHVREGQIVQETLSRIRVNVVPVDGFGERDRADITRRIRQRVGDDVEVIVAPVADIPRTRAGKFKAVVSLLSDAERPASWQTGG